jgi:hypothetical protein
MTFLRKKRVLKDQRNGLPYGVWLCADGREVLFDRKYHPMRERFPGQGPRLADPSEWVNWCGQRWLYLDATPRRQRLAVIQAALVEWCVA